MEKPEKTRKSKLTYIYITIILTIAVIFVILLSIQKFNHHKAHKQFLDNMAVVFPEGIPSHFGSWVSSLWVSRGYELISNLEIELSEIDFFESVRSEQDNESRTLYVSSDDYFEKYIFSSEVKTQLKDKSEGIDVFQDKHINNFDVEINLDSVNNKILLGDTLEYISKEIYLTDKFEVSEEFYIYFRSLERFKLTQLVSVDGTQNHDGQRFLLEQWAERGGSFWDGIHDYNGKTLPSLKEIVKYPFVLDAIGLDHHYWKLYYSMYEDLVYASQSYAAAAIVAADQQDYESMLTNIECMFNIAFAVRNSFPTVFPNVFYYEHVVNNIYYTFEYLLNTVSIEHLLLEKYIESVKQISDPSLLPYSVWGSGVLRIEIGLVAPPLFGLSSERKFQCLDRRPNVINQVLGFEWERMRVDMYMSLKSTSGNKIEGCPPPGSYFRTFVSDIAGLMTASSLAPPERYHKMLAYPFQNENSTVFGLDDELLSFMSPNYWEYFSYTNAINSDCITLTRTRILLTALLFEQYLLKKENDLDAAKEFEIPLDPATGQPLIFEETSNGYIIYGVGPDFKDDGGKSDYQQVLGQSSVSCDVIFKKQASF